MGECGGKRRGPFGAQKRAWDDVRFDCILVDPPRRGLDDATLGALAGFAHVLVVACNLGEAGDCDVLRTHAVAAFAVVDGFPGTRRRVPGAACPARRSRPRRPRASWCVCAEEQPTTTLTKTGAELGRPEARGSASTARRRHRGDLPP